jgi:hypothetical protein
MHYTSVGRRTLLGLSLLLLLAAPALAVPFDVYYRANASSPWVLYATEPDRPAAAAAVAELQGLGYLAEMLSEGAPPVAAAGVTYGPSYSWSGGSTYGGYHYDAAHHYWWHTGSHHHYSYDHHHDYSHHVGAHPTHHPLMHHNTHHYDHHDAHHDAHHAVHRAAHHAAHHASHHAHSHAHGHSGGHRR